MKDREEKIKILFNKYDDFSEYCVMHSYMYKYLHNEEIPIPIDIVNDRIKQFHKNYDMRILENLRKSFLKRRARLHERMYMLLCVSKINYFVTLTFNDESLIGVKEKTLFDRVSRYLRRFSYYISNVDFGESKGRIHFHCVISLNSKEDYYKLQKWKYGFICIKEIKSSGDYKALANYMNKLVSHTLKNGSKNYNINYCKKLRLIK